MNIRDFGPPGDKKALDDRKKPELKIVQRLQANEGTFDASITALMAYLSAWAYADARTVGWSLGRLGFDAKRTRCAEISIGNPALLLSTTAYLVQYLDDQGQDVLIICFRGTMPTHAISWLTDASTAAAHFSAVGDVHEGFHRSTRAVWSMLKEFIGKAADHVPIDSVAQAMRQNGLSVHSAIERVKAIKIDPLLAVHKKQSLAIYIAGHSLGAANALLAAALLHDDPDCADLRKGFRGVYAFGAPMVGGKMFARECEERFGKKVFRMIYGNDIVARLPPASTGKFVGFGAEYRSSETGWMRSAKHAKQVQFMLTSATIGIMAWLVNQLGGFRIFKLAERCLGMPVSWMDHGPIYYLRASLASPAGAEFSAELIANTL